MRYLLVALVLALTACSSDPASPDNGKPSTQMVLDGQWTVWGNSMRIEERDGKLHLDPRITSLEIYAGQDVVWTGDSTFYVLSNPELLIKDTAKFRFVEKDSLRFKSYVFGEAGFKRTAP